MRTTCGSRSSLACCRRCSIGDLLPAPAIALDAAARESLVPAASLRAHRPRHRCGHDGQRKRVAHMPTATTAEEDSSSKMVQNYPHDFTERQIFLPSDFSALVDFLSFQVFCWGRRFPVATKFFNSL